MADDELSLEPDKGKEKAKADASGPTEPVPPVADTAKPAPAGAPAQPANLPSGRFCFVIEGGEMDGKVVPFQGDHLTIGRLGDNQLVLKHKSVSRRHAEVLKQGEVLLVRDLNSSAGTFVNGQKISTMSLKGGDRVRLGAVVLVLQDQQGGGGGAKKGCLGASAAVAAVVLAVAWASIHFLKIGQAQ